jgi:4-aminobutyrate aminotransferase
LEHLERYALETVSPAEDTGAIIIEAVQSDGGELVPPANYLPALRELCDRHGIWLIFDEVKIGLGRTGRLFGFQHSDVVPDVITLGKPLGGGLPLSAVVGRAELLDASAYDLFTLGGSPMPVAAAHALLDVLDEDDLIANAAERGQQLMSGLEELQTRHPLIGDVRGHGLIVGVELVADRKTRAPATRDAHRVAYRCFDLGLILIYSGLYGNVLEMTPPLSLQESDVNEALDILDRALADVEAGRFDDAKLEPFAGW